MREATVVVAAVLEKEALAELREVMAKVTVLLKDAVIKRPCTRYNPMAAIKAVRNTIQKCRNTNRIMHNGSKSDHWMRFFSSKTAPPYSTITVIRTDAV